MCIRDRRKYNNEVEKDFVISQDPGEGRTIKENQIVKLIVSNGPKQIEMPSLIGKFEIEAINILDNLGFQIGEIKYEFNDDFENSKVYDQSPKEGIEIEEGRKVDLFVSKGKETISTPTVSYTHLDVYKRQGDSRAYKINDNGIKQLTEDHSLVAELVKEGKISEGDALIHPQKNVITRALGTEKNVSPDIYNYPLDSNDIILLCTDGLINSISEGQIYDILIKNIDFQQKAELLIN